jgi:hypothetical protein
LGLVLEERVGMVGGAIERGEVCPTVFVSGLKRVDGRTNVLEGKVPTGAMLIAVDGNDTHSLSLDETTQFFHQGQGQGGRRQLQFQEVLIKLPSASGAPSVIPSALRRFADFLVDVPAGTMVAIYDSSNL